jgi:acetylglutamate kinase
VITVIKLGGRVQSDPGLIASIRKRWKRNPGSLCVVHGGGDEISTLQRQLGREPSFVNGRRITTRDDMDLVRMVLSGSANKRLVSALSSAGVPSVGLSGEDGGMISAEPIDENQFGRAGKPTSVNPGVIESLLASQFLPVISPVGIDATSDDGAALNVNGDDASAAIAAALGAELLMVADVPGVMDSSRSLIRSLDQQQVDALVADGTVNRGMHAKLEAGFAALTGGANRVRIGGLEAISEDDAGTLLSLTPSMK